MFVIAGLGNPGDKFHGTRHNIGFYVLDRLAEEQGIPIYKKRHKAILGEGRIGTERVLLVKPQTYMNLSGQSLLDIRNFYRLENDRFIVVYDDIDLDAGILRIRPNGSAGTHNGMRSIIFQLGTEDFPRVRVGIGRPPEGWDLADYVLSRFREEEIQPVKDACDRAVKGIMQIVTQGVTDAMSRFNG